MIGAIIGDMVGSVYEFNNIKTKDFNIFNNANKMTDDSYLTIAVAKVLLKHYPLNYTQRELNSIKKELIKEFKDAVIEHPFAGFGGFFFGWAIDYNKTGYKPYNSYGNGSAMRISPVGWIANSEEEVKLLSKTVTEITHNHIEGLKGAEAIAMCIYLARTGKSKEEIKDYVIKNYYPEVADLDYDELVKHYEFSEICQKSCPQAIYCFLISNSLEDAVRNCVGIGGDCDTTGAMAGAIAEAYYNRDKLSEFEDKFIYLHFENDLEGFYKNFYKTIGCNKFNNISKAK